MTLNEIISRHQLKITITVRRRKGHGIKQLTVKPPWAYCEISGDMGFSKKGTLSLWYRPANLNINKVGKHFPVRSNLNTCRRAFLSHSFVKLR